MKQGKCTKWSRFFCLLMAIIMTMQLGAPVFAAEEQASPDENAVSAVDEAPAQEKASKFEFVEVKRAEDLTSDGTYAIVQQNRALYHKEQADKSDQLMINIKDGRLTLANFPENEQTWILTGSADKGYTVKSCSGKDMYLNLNAVTTSANRVPVGTNAQPMQIQAVANGFTVSRQEGENTLYLARKNGNDQFYVAAEQCTVRIFKKTPVAPQPPVDPVNPLDIPGYTRLTKPGEIVPGKYYLLVSQDSQGNLYAFYPNAEFKDAPSGDAVTKKYEGVFVAGLSVKGNTVSAKLEQNQSVLQMDALRFTVEKQGDRLAFLGSNNLYLSLTDSMLSETPSFLAATEREKGFSISNGDRFLDLNKRNDKMSFNPNAFYTNFWGPKGQYFPLYIYAQDGAVAPTIVKSALRAAIAKAEVMLNGVCDESKAELTRLITEGKAALASDDQKKIDAAAAALNQAMLEAQPREDMIAKPAPKTGTIEGQPFTNVTGSKNFRIPAIITLKDGTLMAAADARWGHSNDGSNIDTMVAISKDNGKTWSYSFPNFFNDSCRETDGRSTVFIDPVLVEGKDGTIYMMVDAYSGGNWTPTLHKTSGYEEVDGKLRMVLYKEVLNNQVDANWSFYVGDFAAEGSKSYAPVYARGDNKTPVAYVDEYYYLYSAKKTPLYCPQLGSDKFVQQNVFFYNANYHVANACFLWLISSKDQGKTWSAPTILNTMVREYPARHTFYGVGPGSGLCLSDGTLMLPVYEHSPEKASFIYSNDNGTTWHRSETATQADWSSESFLVELDVNTVRHFYRDGHNVMRYTDHTRNSDNTWKAGTPVRVDSAIKTTGCQVSGVKYSKQLDGKDVIMVSTAASGSHARRHGRVYTFALNNDEGRTMELIGTYEVTAPNGYYAYSSITVQKDGTIGLLYEHAGSQITYKNITLKELLNVKEVEVELDVDTKPTQSFDVRDESKKPSNSNPEVVKAELQTTKLPDGMGRTGENKFYDGAVESLNTALYTFKKDGNKWQASAKTADGKDIWLNAAGEVGYPFSAAAISNSFDARGNDGVFVIHAPNAKRQERYLAFTLSETHGACAFDGGQQDMGDICSFKLYAPVAGGQQSSKEIPGYVQVNTIEEGGRYLIAYTYGDQTFVLRPSTNTENRYAHVLKVATTKTELVLTAVSAGTADVKLGNVVYHVTVTGEPETQPNVPTEPETQPSVPTEPETQPSVPTEPEAPTTAPSTDPTVAPEKPATPQTGDNSHFVLWISLTLMSGLCLAAAVLYLKKKSCNN